MSKLIEKKEAIDCPICCSSRSKTVKCLYCNFTACSECSQKYLLDNIIPKCMSCSKQWSFEFIQTCFSMSFLNGKYKHHRENILFDREQTLMPDTQKVLEKKNKEKKIQEKLRQLKEQEEELLLKLRALNRVRTEVYTGNKEKIIKCTGAECRGFLKPHSKELLQCGVCKNIVCKDCREDRKENDEHKCNKETIDTIKMIEKECKPCPKCACMILKSEGCDQMWCTQCQTAFSWRTGIVETGVVHNPHYWEYLRRNGREEEEINRVYGNRRAEQEEMTVCNYNMQTIYYNREYRVNVDCFNRFFIELMRLETHIRISELPGMQVNTNSPHLNEDIRLRYLNNEMDEKSFKQLLQRRNKLHEFKNEKYMIFNTYSTVFREIIIKFMHVLQVRFERLKDLFPHLKEMIGELDNLLNFTKDSYNRLCSRFNYTEKNIDMDQSMNCLNRIKNILEEIEKDQKVLNKKMVY